jgi:hypothetical protein
VSATEGRAAGNQRSHPGPGGRSPLLARLARLAALLVNFGKVSCLTCGGKTRT